MKKHIKLILFGTAVLSAVIYAVYYMNAPITVPLAEVTSKTAEFSFTEQGLTVADNVVQIYPLTQGEVVKVNVTNGQSISAGDVICVINPAPIEGKISQIESSIKAYEAQLSNIDTEQEKLRNDLLTSKNSLQGELRALEAQEENSALSLETHNASMEEKLRLQNILIQQSQKDLDMAAGDLTKAEELYKMGIISKSDYEDAVLNVSRAASALEAGKQELSLISSDMAIGNEEYYRGMKDSLNAQIEGIDRTLGKNYTTSMKQYYEALISGDRAAIAQLELDLDACNVTAPTDGIITNLDVKKTNFASISAPVAEITASGGNTIEAFVSTKDIYSIGVGDTVGLTLKRRENDVAFSGTVTNIDSVAQIKLSPLGAEEYKVKVNISPDTDALGDISLGIGYDVEVKFFIYVEKDKLTVPKTALFTANDRDNVWIVRDGRTRRAEVVKGMELRTETVILSGLENGDFVVTDANNEDLKDGVKVKNE